MNIETNNIYVNDHTRILCTVIHYTDKSVWYQNIGSSDQPVHCRSVKVFVNNWSESEHFYEL